MKLIIPIAVLASLFGCSPKTEPQVAAPQVNQVANDKVALETERDSLKARIKTAQDLLTEVDQKGSSGSDEVSKAAMEVSVPIFEKLESLEAELAEVRKKLGEPAPTRVLTESERAQFQKYIVDTEAHVSELKKLPTNEENSLAIRYGEAKIRHWKKLLNAN